MWGHAGNSSPFGSLGSRGLDRAMALSSAGHPQESSGLSRPWMPWVPRHSINKIVTARHVAAMQISFRASSSRVAQISRAKTIVR